MTSQNYLTDQGAYTLSTSPYGTFDQGGNVWEWNEALIGSSSRGVRGGSWSSLGSDFLHANFRNSLGSPPTTEGPTFGFRVASAAIPEPGCMALCCLAGVFALALRRRDRLPPSRF